MFGSNGSPGVIMDWTVTDVLLGKENWENVALYFSKRLNCTLTLCKKKSTVSMFTQLN